MVFIWGFEYEYEFNVVKGEEFIFDVFWYFDFKVEIMI